MSNKDKITLGSCVDVIVKLANDFNILSSENSEVPNSLIYKIASDSNQLSSKRDERKAALASKKLGFYKVAFDTRHYDQETTRNPRSNLQNWHRSEQFIDDETQTKIDVFSKLLRPLEELKQTFGAQPEWHESYSRTLYDHVFRILRVKEADLDIFRPQLSYLEQLLFARYRLSMEEIKKMKEADIKEAIIKKDESLLKRGAYLSITSDPNVKQSANTLISKDGNGMTQDSIVNAIFGNSNFRLAGEKTVERTITITIKDNVIE